MSSQHEREYECDPSSDEYHFSTHRGQQQASGYGGGNHRARQQQQVGRSSMTSSDRSISSISRSYPNHPPPPATQNVARRLIRQDKMPDRISSKQM